MSRQADGPNLDRLHVINDDGSRRYVFPADVRGKWNRIKPWFHAVLIVIYVGLPWVTIDDKPAIHIDIAARRFVLFGEVFNAQDFYLMFSLLTGIGFALIFLSALFGRVWCGWACPQTVFLEGVFRRIERWIEGPAAKRRALAAAPWGPEKIAKRVLKHGVYLAIAWLIAHTFLAYFVSAHELGVMIVEGPAAHPVSFAWGMVPTLALYFNFWWFREQLCLIICPYGRLQSALQDDDTIVIGYDEKRGEPRGKKSDPNAGDCVDCGRCVAVCPTDIDIRNGLQMECIGCANCIDACDEIMVKLDRPTGLIRYDSHRGFTTGEHRFVRPRVFAYIFAGLVGLGVAVFLVTGRTSFEANVVRPNAVPFVIDGDTVRSNLFIHVINKNNRSSLLNVRKADTDTPGVEVLLPQQQVTLEPWGNHKLPVLLSAPRDGFPGRVDVPVIVSDSASGTEKLVEVPFLGPRSAP